MKRKKSFIHIDWKIGLIFLVFSVCCRTVYAQTVSVELKKATVAEALKKMSAVTGYEFFYNSKSSIIQFLVSSKSLRSSVDKSFFSNLSHTADFSLLQ